VGLYWSSTADAADPDNNVWFVDFSDGEVFSFIKVSEQSVRAVRSGL
jgi:hypothetical protein